jgi:hypothetical protein
MLAAINAEQAGDANASDDARAVHNALVLPGYRQIERR